MLYWYGCGCFATAQQALNPSKETVMGRKRSKRRTLWHFQCNSYISVRFSMRRKCHHLPLFFPYQVEGWNNWSGQRLQLHHNTGKTKEVNLVTDMKGFAEFHGRTLPPWDKTAVEFMLNSFLGLAPKTTGSFVFAHLYCTPQTLGVPAFPQSWRCGHQSTKLSCNHKSLEMLSVFMFLTCILTSSGLPQQLTPSKPHVQQTFQIYDFIKKHKEQ